MATSRHSHKHTHQLGDGNGHPVHEPEQHEHEHEEGPTRDASRHHIYTEEPKVVMGPITAGQWMLAAADPGEPMTRDHPGVPGHPAYIYVTRGDEEVVIAYIAEPSYIAAPGDVTALPELVDIPMLAGSWEANAKLMTFSPALLRFVQSLASYAGVGVPDLAMRDRAWALIEQLNQVEVRSDADRW